MEDKEYLYEVKLRVLISLTTPPDHPEVKAHLLENVVDYLDVVKDGKAVTRYDADTLIDSFYLIEVRDL